MVETVMMISIGNLANLNHYFMLKYMKEGSKIKSTTIILVFDFLKSFSVNLTPPSFSFSSVALNIEDKQKDIDPHKGVIHQCRH